jgi:chemotaxis protein CheX
MPSLELSLFESAVSQTVVYVFESMLNTSPEPAADETLGSVELVTAVLHFSGGWTGATLLEMPPVMARVFTGRMLGLDAPARIDDDVIDAMGELVNMIGGNLKTILPPGVELSLPSVVIGADYSLRICGGRLVHRWTFGGELGRFWVSIIEVQKPGP